MKVIRIFIVLLLMYSLVNCSHQDKEVSESKDLFNGFVNPPANSRPFVRWWWNGNHITVDEIKRELQVLHKAGVGGVEINPIEMPSETPDIGTKPLTWLSRDWNDLLVTAAKEAQKRGMVADLIVGSGWPFGGEFLKENETIQRIIINKIPCKKGDIIRENSESLYNKALEALSRRIREEAQSYDVVFIRLIPDEIRNLSEIIDLTEKFKASGFLNHQVPDGNFHLVYGMLQRGNRQVMHGAPGAAGPVMNHYRKEITLAYLNRLNKISMDTGVPLKDLVRALFCDSIELDGANWTDGMDEIFFKAYGYRIGPYFPFVFYDPYSGYADEKYLPEMEDRIRRVRYDFNKLLIRVFLDNFTKVFQEFCTENGLLCRYQAYGTPFLMGMMEGNMIPDIPESNNWIYSAEMHTDEWIWNQGHGYMIWNLYASSGGHLTGRKIISCEAMTNTRGVFKASLEEIKRHDDMNFITGINHSVLHGFNYSPPEAGFPGWVRFGAFFSEQNPWWPYFPEWAEYNARLSFVFQNSKPLKKIAILGPEGDLWSTKGLIRVPFHMEPWYCYRLWEPLSQVGSSCDYVSEKIVREGKKEKGLLSYGPMSYQVVFLCNIQSLEPETAIALNEFVKNGGKVVVIDHVPERSLSFINADSNDSIVRESFNEMANNNPELYFPVSGPVSESDLLTWTESLLQKINLDPDVRITDPDKNVFQIHKRAGDLDIWFFVNSNRSETVTLNAVFPTGKKIPWIWNPEDGTREVFPFEIEPAKLNIELQPLKSLLLVFDPDEKGQPAGKKLKKSENKLLAIEGPWQVKFEHVNGQNFERKLDKLIDFGTSDDREFRTFAGTVVYSATFSSDGNGDYLEFGKVNKGVTEVFINGKPAGLNWYGKPLFLVRGLLEKGENKLEIRYTSILSNYVRSLKDNPTAMKWTAGYENLPMGLEGEVAIYY